MNKSFVIIFLVFIIFLIVRNEFFLDNKNFEIKNSKIIKAKFLGYCGGRNFTNGSVSYEYNGKLYKSINLFHSVLGCFETNDELLIKIDTLCPQNYAYVPDTFFFQRDYERQNSNIYYDTFLAYNLDYNSSSQSIKFNINIEGKEFEFEKLTNLKPKVDTMYYIVVNRNLRQGFLKYNIF